MLAMQYSFTLPADYDMRIIRRRIADKGHLLDDFPGLAFKAYLYALRDDDALPGADNQYAPFYLWRHVEGMNAFLGDAGFAGLCRDFGRPPVRTWVPWQVQWDDDLRDARCASRDTTALPAHVAPGEQMEAEAESVRKDRAAGALAAVTACDYARWQWVRLRLWPELHPGLAAPARQLYRVGHVSQPPPSH